MSELPIIQKIYDLIKWYVPILNRLPRDHKFMLWDRMITGLYDLLDGIIIANYPSKKRVFRNYYANVQNEHFVVAQLHQYVGHTKILISCATTIAYLTREEPNLSIDLTDEFFSSRR